MPIKWLKRGPALLILITACTGLPFWAKDSAGRAPDSAQSLPHVHLEFQDIHYDGLTLTGRVLISPEGKSLRLDKRLIPTIDVHISSVADCTRQPLTSIKLDVFGPAAREEDLLVLEPGYWYGATVRFVLFSEHFTGRGPECIDAQLLLFSFEGKLVASVPVRAIRALQPSTDGGIREEPPLAPDAGSP